MRNRKKIGIVAIASILLLSGCGRSVQEAPELLEPASVGVSTIKVERRSFYSADSIDVSVVPETTELYFTMDGQLSSVRVNEGQLVKEGEVLATIDQSDLMDQIKEVQEEIGYIETSYAHQLKQLNLAVQIAQLQYEKLQADYERAQQPSDRSIAQAPQAQEREASELQENSEGDEESRTDESAADESSLPEDSAENSEDSSDQTSEDSSNESSTEESSDSGEESSTIAPQPPVSGVTQYDIEQARIKVRQAELAYTQKQEEYQHKASQKQQQRQILLDKVGEDTLKAPCSGRIVSVLCNEGERVNEYKTVMILANEDVIQLRGDKYSNSSLKRFTKMDVVINNQTYEVTYIPYDEEYYYQAALNKIVLPSRFSFKTEPEVQFGESGTVRVYREYSEDTLVLPRACVQSDEMGYFVYKAQDGQRVKTYITIGITTATHTEVVDGLHEGDEIYGRE